MRKFEPNYLLPRNLRLWPNSDIIDLEWPQGLIVLEIVVNGPKIWLHFIYNYILNLPPQFHSPSVQHKRVTPFQPPKSHSSTLELRGSSTQKNYHKTEGCVEHRGFWFGTEDCVELRVFGVELREFWCGTESCVELRGFWCGTEGCVELWGFGVELTGFRFDLRSFWCGTDLCVELTDFSVELRDFGCGKGVVLCWPDMLNWGGPCGTEGYSF